MLTVLGTTTVDLFVRGMQGMPERGEDEFSNSSLVWLKEAVVPSLGGNGANAAYSAGALGEQVRLWSAVGNDPFGQLALGWLRSRSIDLSDLLVTPLAGTATTVVLTDTALRRNSFHYPGPAQYFMPLAKSAGTTGDWLLITGYALLLNWRGEATRSLLEGARTDGVRTALDLGPILGEPIGKDEVAPLLPYVDVLFCNEFELEEVTGCKIDAGVEWAFSAGAGCIVVKQGADGAMVFATPDADSAKVPGFPVSVIGTVGAGDSFDVGFLHAYSRGSSPRDSARFANAVAALVVSSPRGILDAPDTKRVQAFLANAS